MDLTDKIFQNAAAQGRTTLTEAECYLVFNAIGLKTPKIKIISREDDICEFLKDFGGDKTVIKVLSSQILHKTDAGGVKICNKSDAKNVWQSFKAAFPQANNFMLCEFMEYTPFALGAEILLGARRDKAFGPVITLGIGGTDAEFLASSLKDSPTAITNAEEKDFKTFIKNSFVWRYAGGLARGAKPLAEICDLENWLKKIAALMLEKSDFTIEELEINPLAASKDGLCALDGLIRFSPAKKEEEKLKVTKSGIKALLEPQTVAVSGVSGTKINMGRIILRNIKESGFDPENLFIIKPGESGNIDGVKCFESCAALPRKVDNLIITVPAKNAADALKDAAQSGKVNGVIVISGGIGEKQGTQDLMKTVEDIIKKGKEINPNFTLNGSNSLGTVSNPAKVNALFIPKSKFTPPLGENKNHAPCAFISQSGAFVISSLSRMEEIKPVYCIMSGNQIDVTAADYCEYLANDDKIKVILLYVEGFKRGEGAKMIQTLKKLKSRGKRAVIYLAGRTQAGKKAVMGHTASIAGDYVTAKTLLQKEGAFMAATLEDFISLSRLACTLKKPASNKVFMISNAGFESSAMADALSEKGPLCCELPQAPLKDKLSGILARYGLSGLVDVRNPFDVTPMCPDQAALEAVEEAAASGQYGAILFATVPLSPAIKTLREENPFLMQKLAEISKKYSLPLVISVSAGNKFNFYRDLASEAGLPVFNNADEAVRKLALFIKLSV